MLVSSWASVNPLVQNKFRSTIHLLSQHLLVQSHRWKHQMNVWNQFKVKNKDTRLMSWTWFWCPKFYLQIYFTIYSSVFSVYIADSKQAKSRLGSRSHRSKKSWYSYFVVCKKHLIYCSQGELRTCDTSKMDLFAKIVYRLKSTTILTRSSILRSIAACWIYLG